MTLLARPAVRAALALAVVVVAVAAATFVFLGRGTSDDSGARPRSGAQQGAQLAAQEAAAGTAVRHRVPPVRHVFVINIENKDYDRVWGPASQAPYLARTLRSKGVLLRTYYGTAHHSLGNYLAQVSGQGVTPQIQSDCQAFADWTGRATTAFGQYVGRGCVFPAATPTVSGQLDRAGRDWRGYMEDLGTPCRHPRVGASDDTQRAEAGDQYATRHNPFMYFHSIIDRPAYCARHVVDLNRLRSDLQRSRTTPNLSYITPDLCSDGHDQPCVDGRPGGLASVDRWMRTWVPVILRSPAFRRNGMLVITADESDSTRSDSRACCHQRPGPNASVPGITGPGGGRIGALVISRWSRPGTSSRTPYNHYSLLGSVEDIFGLSRLGFAAAGDLETFGRDVYNAWSG